MRYFIFYPGMEPNLGVFGFSCYQNKPGLSGAYVTCIYCGLSVKINMPKNAAGCGKIMGAFRLRLFLRVWSTKT